MVALVATATGSTRRLSGFAYLVGRSHVSPHDAQASEDRVCVIWLPVMRVPSTVFLCLSFVF